MDDLKSHKAQLEANLKELSNFEGLESDLIQKHSNLRSQFAEYREVIETSNVSEKEKREHFGYHDELIIKLHKIVLEAKALTRKRTEQMTRDELFKLSQERQKALKPQSAEDKVGEEVTKSLKRMLETMRSEVERSSANISTARSTTKNLEGTTENYQKLSGTLEESRGLIRDLWRRNRSDMIYIFGALGVFIATVIWVILQRTPGVVWLPGKIIVKQLGNLVPKPNKLVDKITEVAESILSDDEAPSMYVDTILREEKEEYGNDDLLKEDKKHVIVPDEQIIADLNPSEEQTEETVEEPPKETIEHIEPVITESSKVSEEETESVQDRNLAVENLVEEAKENAFVDIEENKNEANSSSAQEPVATPIIEIEKRDTESEMIITKQPEKPEEFVLEPEVPVVKESEKVENLTEEKKHVIEEPFNTLHVESVVDVNENAKGLEEITNEDAETSKIKIKPSEREDEFPSFSEVVAENNEVTNIFEDNSINVTETPAIVKESESTKATDDIPGTTTESTSAIVRETPVIQPSSDTETNILSTTSTEPSQNKIEPTDTNDAAQTDSERYYTSDAEFYSTTEGHMEL